MKYKLTNKQMEIISPLLRRLDGADIMMANLAENIGTDKFLLWETVYQTYPELRGKSVGINEHKKEVVVHEKPIILAPGRGGHA